MNGSGNAIETIVERIRAIAARTPDKQALVVLPESDVGGRPTTVSYGALDAAARRLAGWLQARGASGERVLVLHADRRLFAISFLACLYAGAVAVPAPVLRGRPHHRERIAALLKDAAPCAVLTDPGEAPEVSRLLADHSQGHLPCLVADVVPQAEPWREPELTADTLAFLQYTSGSTAEPRGVMVTHRNLVSNQLALTEALDTREGTTLGGWLPFHHDMGLVGQLLHPLWLGATSVVLSPEAFVRRPMRWLEAISLYGIEVSGAPDFAYDLLLRCAPAELPEDLDLSSWRTAVNGGEPIRPDTWWQFAERFAPAGLRASALTAGYGLAEATLLVTAGPAGPGREVDAAELEHHRLRPARPGRPTRLLTPSGRPVGTELRIVDPADRRVRPTGEIGEIWVRGDGVAPGYWRRRAKETGTFGARTADGDGGFLRTGDLGALTEDGALQVTGRIKDVIVTAGRNLYPQDLERTVQRVSDLFGAATAFAVQPDRERIVIVQELRSASLYGLDLPGLADAVQRCLAAEFEVQAGAVLLVRPGTVRRTTSGKVERDSMRRLFLDGELCPIYQEIKPEVRQLLTGSRE